MHVVTGRYFTIKKSLNIVYKSKKGGVIKFGALLD